MVDCSGALGKGEVDLCAALHIAGVDLRQVGIDAQGLRGLHVEELACAALGDQLAGIDVAGGDHAVKGRVDLLKRLQFLEPLHVGLCGLDRGGGGCSLVDEGVRVLLRDCVRLHKVRVTVGLNAGVVGRGLGGNQVVGCDLRQERTFLHPRADVVVPLGEVAGGAGVDGRISVRGDVAGQLKAVRRRTLRGRNGNH